MKIVVYNLGCKVNQYESDSIIRELKSRGHEVYDNFTEADAYILNTCAVTNEAERKSRQAIARAKKFNATAKIIVCGCASENNAEQFSEKDGVVYISGVAGKARIPGLIKSKCDTDLLSLVTNDSANSANIGQIDIDIKNVSVSDLPTVYEDDLAIDGIRTRAFLKVQDGCNNFCSYCIIPYLRGRSRSRAIDSVVQEFNRLSKQVKEIVLTGINLSAYGLDIASSLKELLVALKGFDTRIRFGSLEVNIIDSEFLEACKSIKRFCPQFHLSLQSGDDSVLKDMNRHYTTVEYLDKVKLIREYFPDAAITTDLICGYPTESEQSFKNTIEFIKKVNFADMHIFVYSPRKGTKAAKLKQIPHEVAKERANTAIKIAEDMKREYLKSHIGSTLEVLVENGYGYSMEYIKVYTDGEDGEIEEIAPTELYLDGLK